MNNYIAILEGLLFLKGDEGTTIKEICYCLEVSETEAYSYVEQLDEKYCLPESGIYLNRLNNKYRLMTKKEFSTFYNKILLNPITQKLSNAALETLAIIAYKQPTTRAIVSDIRGVNSDGIIKSLNARNLIKEVGVLDVLGKPIIYGTTDEFLDLFNLSSLEELPLIEDFAIDEKTEYDLFNLNYHDQKDENDVES